jgi:acetyl esterase/lipase
VRVRRRTSLLALALAAALPAAGETRLLESLAFAPGSSARLDLYLPEPSSPPAALLVFVHSRFWGPGARDAQLAQGLARPLQRAGAAVAILRPRPAQEASHPAAAEDVAAGLAYLLGRADELGIDGQRVVLSGHASGAQLAALVALDPRYLSAHGMTPSDLRGVAAISGVYDLDGELASDEQRQLVRRVFDSRRKRRDASPLRHARADAATFVALAAQQDAPGAREAAEALARALREAGHAAAEALFIGGRDHWSQLDLRDDRNPLRQHLLALLTLDERWGSIEDVLATRRFWRDPPFSTRGFWESGLPVERHEADERFLHTLNLMFAKPGRPRPLRPGPHHAIDLIGFVEQRSLAQGESGDFVTVRNLRGEQMVWRLSDLRSHGPRIVIGLDDERELFRLTDVYHTLRRYTWRDADPHPWVLARPLGAFVYFTSEPPAHLEPKLFGRFGLLPEGFSRSASDPLVPLRSLPEPARSLVVDELRCVSCHQLRGAGARASHLRATDGEPVGGFALPLEEYPPEVWRRYCFEQSQVAAEIGASVVDLSGERARLLFELVEAERAR